MQEEEREPLLLPRPEDTLVDADSDNDDGFDEPDEADVVKDCEDAIWNFLEDNDDNEASECDTVDLFISSDEKEDLPDAGVCQHLPHLPHHQRESRTRGLPGTEEHACRT